MDGLNLPGAACQNMKKTALIPARFNHFLGDLAGGYRVVVLSARQYA